MACLLPRQLLLLLLLDAFCCGSRAEQLLPVLHTGVDCMLTVHMSGPELPAPAAGWAQNAAGGAPAFLLFANEQNCVPGDGEE